MENPIGRILEHWLVYHPNILNFTWNPPHTPASSLLFLSLSIASYLSLTLLLLFPLPPIPPHFLKPFTALHNLILSILSLIMAIGTSLTILTHTPNLRSTTICFPPHTPPNGPLFFWAYIFYLSKYLEFIDTLFIILSRSIKRLSFLHVYHHSTVPVMCYLWLNSSQSLFPIALLTNSSVHVIMYSYYFLTTVGIRPPWKRVVTDCQIVQFVFSFAVSGLMLYYHFGSDGGGCCGMKAWCFNAVFNASLLALFLDFHLKSYANSKNKKRTTDKDS
ncbi:putative very-long-chain 3-oxoacyl-CoA synthase [Medicago truncatula]|uniref:very-long-chain 3-oxoacyl-CoA synthase n=1 Tax=Medicago truncatula TaxID=3880 RepID=Q2HTN1_MEDTR|nr:putative elongation of fatty acids protein DDB_G0272012 [Medicago truncatula]ABD32385.2 GNS1/SUR4 membrane protein [Medicago truncatula]AES82531.1 GNS1/SUR4 membrane family protein [Medicago truncatula]AFK42960.1 unknown [Medicago truncatula]RHN49301.1 putative very-long-chain 3-oxoacyl-CoA synthase [Medicago truncatula]